jgi:hypothetical protein
MRSVNKSLELPLRRAEVMNIMNEIHEGNTEAMWELEELEWEYYAYLRNLLDLSIYPIR